MSKSFKNSTNFKEIIGQVFNITWEMIVTFKSSRDSNRAPCWTLCLKKNQSNCNVAVTIKLISRNRVKSYYLTYDTKEDSKFILNQNTLELDDYNLELFFIFKSTSTPEKNLAKIFPIVKLQNLSTSFQAMLEKEYMTDVVLKCDSFTLKAHKSILSIQSPVFEAMFTSPILKNKQDTAVVEDVDPSVLQAMVSFMYSGQVKVGSESIIYDLLHAAEKYRIDALKEGCIEYLQHILSPENAVKILEVSNVFDQQLKSHCLDYIKNEFKSVKSTKDWKDLKQKNRILALEVYSFCESD
ncbi:speckle-type POZ protein B-like [Parasteatoda tepidariorum]|uniref:speckle-type POZ protein B-like n=1 Tax=Parasteatoda tepidariorum TaxID=114398 RepID=UPI0039BCE512